MRGWIPFESGALSKTINNTFVCTLLIDLEPSEVRGPLAQFQATRATRTELFELLSTLNNALGAAALPDAHLREAFVTQPRSAAHPVRLRQASKPNNGRNNLHIGHMSRFVIADITDAKSVLQELRSIVPNSPSVLVQPLLLASQEEPGMCDFFRKFPWVLEPVRYSDQPTLIAQLDERVIAPAESKAVPAKS